MAGLAVMVSLGVPFVASAADPKSQERFEQQMGKEGNQNGVPEPGLGEHQEEAEPR